MKQFFWISFKVQIYNWKNDWKNVFNKKKQYFYNKFYDKKFSFILLNFFLWLLSKSYNTFLRLISIYGLNFSKNILFKYCNKKEEMNDWPKIVSINSILSFNIIWIFFTLNLVHFLFTTSQLLTQTYWKYFRFRFIFIYLNIYTKLKSK